MLLCQRVLAMPNKRHERKLIEFLHREEIDALVTAPNPSTWIGRRDRTFLIVAVQTGLRVSELIGLRCQDVVLGTGAHVQCIGKGRKHRATPLREEAAGVLNSWLRERNGLPQDPVFPSIRGGSLSRDAIERLVAKHTITAQQSCPSLNRKKITPHALRHYVPFLTMSGNVKDSADIFGNCSSRDIEIHPSTRHSFRLETVEEIQ